MSTAWFYQEVWKVLYKTMLRSKSPSTKIHYPGGKKVEGGSSQNHDFLFQIQGQPSRLIVSILFALKYAYLLFCSF